LKRQELPGRKDAEVFSSAERSELGNLGGKFVQARPVFLRR
jgi:hypothetical protein